MVMRLLIIYMIFLLYNVLWCIVPERQTCIWAADHFLSLSMVSLRQLLPEPLKATTSLLQLLMWLISLHIICSFIENFCMDQQNICYCICHVWRCFVFVYYIVHRMILQTYSVSYLYERILAKSVHKCFVLIHKIKK